MKKFSLLKKLKCIFSFLFIVNLPCFAQSNYTASELDTLVSNIALYPDQLLIHVLNASTYSEQIPAASIWAESHKDLKGESLANEIENANLTFDPSVQALLPFPSVLFMMDKYRTWTDQLGDAITGQKEDVLDAIQRLRQVAYNHGHLISNEQVKVEKGENITIVPVRTEYVYVPIYNPRVVYYVHANGYTRVNYGTGIWLGSWYGEWGWGSCWFDWGPRVIYVRNTRWYAHRPIPRHPRRYRAPPRRHRHQEVQLPSKNVSTQAPIRRVEKIPVTKQVPNSNYGAYAPVYKSNQEVKSPVYTPEKKIAPQRPQNKLQNQGMKPEFSPVVIPPEYREHPKNYEESEEDSRQRKTPRPEELRPVKRSSEQPLPPRFSRRK